MFSLSTCDFFSSYLIFKTVKLRSHFRVFAVTMKSLKPLIIRRIFHNRSCTPRSLKSPVIEQPSYKSNHKTNNYSLYDSPRFYCISSANPIDSAISSPAHQSTLQHAIDFAEIPNLTDDELFKIITQLRDSLLNKTNRELRGYNQTTFMKFIEDECIRRARQNWNLDKTVDVLDMFNPKSRFLCPNLLFWLLRTKFKSALKSETPTMMKYIAAIEKNNFWTAYYINCYHVELALIKRLDQFSLPEISSLLYVFKKRLAKIVSQELINNLYDRLLKEIDLVDSRTLNTFLLFFSDQRTNIDINQIVPHLNKKLREPNSVNAEGIAIFCTRKKIYNPEILNHLAEHLIKQLPDISIVELESIVASLVFFNYNSLEIYQKLIDTFEGEPLRTTLLEHPKRLAKILGNLCLINVYPYKSIDQVLSEKFLKKTFGKRLNAHSVLREVMILDGCVKAECPDYEGNKLDDELEKILLSHWSSHIHHYLRTDGDTIIVSKSERHNQIEYEPTLHNGVILEASRILRNVLGGPEYVHTCYTIPFLPRPDLLFCLNRDKQPIKLPDQIFNSIRVDFKNLDKSVDWYVILCVHQHPILKGENIIYGKDIAKERILRKHGFKLVTIVLEMWCDWTEEEKKNYLKEFTR